MNPSLAAQFLRREAELTAAGDREGAVRCVHEAIGCCKQTLTAQPNNLDAVAFMASCYMKLGRLDEAISSYRKAIDLNPNIALLNQNLGLALLHQSKLDAAEEPFRRAIALDPANASHSFSGLAQIVLACGDAPGAAALFRKAYECHPNSPIGQFYLGRALIHEDSLIEAEAAFREAISKRPNFGDAYRLLGQILQQQGRFDDAEVALRKAIDLDPARGHPYVSIAEGRKMTEEDRPLIGKMRELLAGGQLMAADQCSLRYALGKSLNDLGEYGAAIAEYDEANLLAWRILHQGKPFDRSKLTTAYDYTVSLFSPEFFAKRRHLGSKSDMPIFIVGMMRSGTTLTEQIISCHPEVAAGGELLFWISEGNGILDPVKQTIDEPHLRRVQKAYLDVLRGIGQGKPRVTDKRPGNYGILGLIHLAFPKAKIIHCKRDPVDTALSIYMTRSALVEFGHVREDIAFAYKEYQKLMRFYRQILPPDSMLDVQYEELVADRETIARRIIDFLGLDWNNACLHHEENSRTVSTPSMWQARQPIYSTSVKKWKKYEPWLGAFKELIEED